MSSGLQGGHKAGQPSEPWQRQPGGSVWHCLCVPDAHQEVPTACHAVQIFQLLFQRLAAKRTTKFTRGFVVALALFVVKHGGAAAQTGVESVQQVRLVPWHVLQLLQACAG